VCRRSSKGDDREHDYAQRAEDDEPSNDEQAFHREPPGSGSNPNTDAKTIAGRFDGVLNRA
jgi:hypothetical protein